jgi:medium-chain acyl-[acyl-carrier-protein] hydrolase
MGLVTKENYRVHICDVDYKGKLLPNRLMDFFQSTSTIQSETIGAGIEVLMQENKAWFLVKYEIDFIKYPELLDEVTASSEATCIDKFYANRLFQLRDKCGDLLAEGRTQWMLADLETGKVTRDMTKYIEPYQLNPEDTRTFSISGIKKLKNIDIENRFKVRYMDIDFNRHVNHVKYLTWVIENISLDDVLGKELAQVRIIYKRQCFYGDIIKVKSQQVDENLMRSEISNHDDVLLCKVETVLRNRQS